MSLGVLGQFGKILSAYSPCALTAFCLSFFPCEIDKIMPAEKEHLKIFCILDIFKKNTLAYIANTLRRKSSKTDHISDNIIKFVRSPLF
jgi:hypothetical protein